MHIKYGVQCFVVVRKFMQVALKGVWEGALILLEDFQEVIIKGFLDAGPNPS